MAGPGIVSQSEGRVVISDDYLDAHKDETGHEIDCFLLTPTEAFINTNIPKKGPGGIFLGRMVSIRAGLVAGVADVGADYGIINGREPDDPEPIQEYFVPHAQYPNRFKYIYPRHTTARGIILHQ